MVHLLHSVKRESPAEIQQSLLALGEELLLFLLSTQEGASQQSSAQVHPPTHTQREPFSNGSAPGQQKSITQNTFKKETYLGWRSPGEYLPLPG